jgi:hypothetical protein
MGATTACVETMVWRQPGCFAPHMMLWNVKVRMDLVLGHALLVSVSVLNLE